MWISGTGDKELNGRRFDKLTSCITRNSTIVSEFFAVKKFRLAQCDENILRENSSQIYTYGVHLIVTKFLQTKKFMLNFTA